MCGICAMCWICVGYVWWIRLKWICVGYVKCAGYVWDMCGVRYANNLLKNPAMKRLSGKKKIIPPNHPLKNRDFKKKNHPFWGFYPLFLVQHPKMALYKR